MQPVHGDRVCSLQHGEDIERLLRGHPKRHTKAPNHHASGTDELALHKSRNSFHGREGFDGVLTLGLD